MPIFAIAMGALAAIFLYSLDNWLALMTLGGVVGWVVWRVGRLEQHLERLAKKPVETEDPPKGTVTTTMPRELTVSTPVAESSSTRMAKSAVKPIPEAPAAEVPHSYWPQAGRSQSTPTAPSAQARPNIVDTAWRFVRRWLTTGNVPVKVGVLVSFLGVGFLLKYASDEGYLVLPMVARLSLVALAGAVMLVVGWRLRARMPVYGLSLQGGGVGVLYLTTFTAMQLFALLSGGFAFLLLVILTAGAMTLALLQNARILAVLGAVGGFLAPVLVSTGEGSHITLFSYYALLNIAILGIAWFKAWRMLNLVGFGFTFVIGTLWGVLSYKPEYFVTTQPFLVLFAFLYIALPLLYAVRQPVRLRGLVDGTLVFGTPALIFPLQAALVQDTKHGLTISAGVLAVTYCLLAGVLLRRWRGWGQLLGEAYLAIGVAFATLAVPLALSARWTASTWALEGAALLWIGLRQGRRLPRWFGGALIVAAGLAFLAGDGEAGRWLLLNENFLGALVIAVAALLAALLLDRHGQLLTRWDRYLAWVLWAWGILWWLGAGVFDIEAQVSRDYQFAGVLVWLAFTAGLFLATNQWLKWAKAAFPVLALLPVATLLLVINMLETLSVSHPFARGAWIGWLMIFGVLVVALRLLEEPFRHLAPAGHAGLVWWSTVLIAWQIYWLAGQVMIGDIWPVVAVLLLAVAWGLFLPLLQRRVPWPFAQFSVAFYGHFLALLLGLALLVAVLLQLTSPANPAPLVYLPLLNPLDIVTGLLLFVAYRSLGPILETGVLQIANRQPIDHALAAIVFVTLTATLARTLHHWSDIPFRVDALMASTLLQASLSILWTSIALTVMVFATRRSQRPLYLVGAALMGIVLLKLFLIDLGSTGTLARIVSFLGVGLMLLVVGYFAPVPPSVSSVQEEEKPSH